MSAIEDARTETAAAFAAGVLNSEPKIVERDGIPILLAHDDINMLVLDVALERADQRAERPRHTKGTSHHSELESFLAHVARFSIGNESVIWADSKSFSVTAIYDYHVAPGVPGWCRYKAVYACPLSDEWKRWSSASGSIMSQDNFADFVEEWLEDLTGPVKGEPGPKPAELLEMARDLRVHSKGRFERKVDPTTGQYAMVCKEEHSESSTKIPRAFYLALRVFEGGEKYRVEARIRFAMHEGNPRFSFMLHRATEIKKDAFAEIRDKITERTGLLLFIGAPEC